jgi:hypothetical protein
MAKASDETNSQPLTPAVGSSFGPKQIPEK